jgi:hypothetical protein
MRSFSALARIFGERLSPMNPRLILLIATVLPGGGHVAMGQFRRALGFVLFMLVLGGLTTQFAAPTVSFVGRHAAGFFVYALSIIDAYRRAAMRSITLRMQIRA